MENCNLPYKLNVLDDLKWKALRCSGLGSLRSAPQAPKSHWYPKMQNFQAKKRYPIVENTERL